MTRCYILLPKVIAASISVCLVLKMVSNRRGSQTTVIKPEKTRESSVRPMTAFPTIEPHSCVKSSRLHGVTATICVKPADQFVSAAILKNGAWEPKLVTHVLKALSLYPEATLVDIGSNIGMFSLMAAGMGRRVVAVDAMEENLAYIHKSLEVSSRTSLVTLLHNSVSNDDSLVLYPVLNHKQRTNPGATRLVPAEALLYSTMKAIGPPTRSVTLPAVFTSVPAPTIVLKMDIEGWECRALLAEGAFDTGKFIPYIFMEWEHLMDNKKLSYNGSSNCPDLEGLLDLLAKVGYTARHPETLQPLDNSSLHTPLMDVIWVHKTAQMFTQ